MTHSEISTIVETARKYLYRAGFPTLIPASNVWRPRSLHPLVEYVVVFGGKKWHTVSLHHNGGWGLWQGPADLLESMDLVDQMEILVP